MCSIKEMIKNGIPGPATLSYGIQSLADMRSVSHRAQTHVPETGQEIAATSWERPVPDRFGASPKTHCFHSLQSWTGLNFVIMQQLKSKKRPSTSQHPSNSFSSVLSPGLSDLRQQSFTTSGIWWKYLSWGHFRLHFSLKVFSLWSDRLGLEKHWNPGVSVRGVERWYFWF